MSRRWPDAFLAVALCALAFAAGTLFYVRHPQFYVNESFLFFDQGVTLYLADVIHSGEMLYLSGRYPYGPLPIYTYATAAALFGNSCYTYLGFQRAVAALNAGLLFLVLRGAGVGRGRATIAAAAAAPYIITPGSVLGDYTTAAYIQLERVYLTLLPALYLVAARRSSRGAATVGIYLAGYQLLKFGGCYFAGATLVALDLARVLASGGGRRGVFEAARFWLAAAGYYAACEGLRCAVAFALLPGPAAWDVVWPAYTWRAYSYIHSELGAFASSPARLAVKCLAPALGAAVAFVALLRRPTASIFALSTYVGFYALGSLKYFGHASTYSQYAWLPVAAAAALLPAGRAGGALATGLMLLSWLVLAGSDTARPRPSAAAPRLRMPNGDELYAARDEPLSDALSEALSKAFAAHYGDAGPPGRVLLLPIGAGYHFYYRTRPFSGDLWYIPAYVDAAAEPELLHAAAETSAVVGPAGDPLAAVEGVFPPGVTAALRARAGPPVRLNTGTAVVFLREK